MRVVEQADRTLSRVLRDTTEELSALDLAHWRPEVAAGRKEAEAALRAAGQRSSRVATARPRAGRTRPHAVAHRAGRPRRRRRGLGVGQPGGRRAERVVTRGARRRDDRLQRPGRGLPLSRSAASIDLAQRPLD